MENMQELIVQLKEAAEAYYLTGNPVMSDAQWDAMYDRLVALEKATGVQLEDSPTRNVGASPLLTSFEKHTHIAKLWSLDKAQNKEALASWFEKVDKFTASIASEKRPTYGIEYKFDGLTINLTYRDGTLVQAATRGNGTQGEGILEQAKHIIGVPRHISYQGLLEVQGECVMPLSALAEYNNTHDELLKNARNAAAGALRNLDPSITAERGLSAYFYEIGTIEEGVISNQQELHAFLVEQGFQVSPYLQFATTFEDVYRHVLGIQENRNTLNWDIDGVVVKMTDKTLRAQMGYTDKFPRWAVAYKFPAQENTTIIEEVLWEVGRTGKVTPKAHVRPVELAGATIEWATLNNFGDISRKKLKIGNEVWIRRSNDVIPEILGSVDEGEAGQTIQKPTHCPSCSSPLVEVGAHLFCQNSDECPPQSIKLLSHYASRDAMNIEGLSEKTLALFFHSLQVTNPVQLYHLTLEQLLTLPSFKQKKAQKLLEAIENSKGGTLEQFLFALGMPNIGKSTAFDLANHYQTIEAFLQTSFLELTQIEGIGDVVAESIISFIQDAENLLMIDELLALGVLDTNTHETLNQSFEGMAFVITGTLPTLQRKQAEAMVLAHGGKVSSAVSKNTTYVLAGEKAGSKLKKAMDLGIPVIDENEFLNMV